MMLSGGEYVKPTSMVGAPIDGFGITCLECGRTFKRHMAGHVWYAHGLLKHDYYRRHNLPLGSRLATNEFRKSHSDEIKKRPDSQIRGRVIIKDASDASRVAKTLPFYGHRNTKGRPLTPEWKSKVVAASKRTGKLRHERAHENRDCKFCGKTFLALISHNPECCSYRCSSKYHYPSNSKALNHPTARAKAKASLRRRYADRWKTINCEICGKEKKVLKVRQTKFCSRKCQGTARTRNNSRVRYKKCLPPPNQP